MSPRRSPTAAEAPPRADSNVRPLREDQGAPPHDLAAEQAVLGALMLPGDVVADVTALIDPGDFYRPAHETILRAILALHERGAPADQITVADELEHSGDLARTGGYPYLDTLVSACPTSVNASYYAGIVADRAHRRRVIETGTRLTQMGANTGQDAGNLLAGATAELASLGPPTGAWPDPTPLGDTRALPPFPTDALPEWVGTYVRAVAEETQTPVDMPGCLALAVLAAAAGGRSVVQARGTWREPTNLYVVVALPPANRKSAVFSLLTGPLYAAEKALADSAAASIAEAQVTARMAREAADKAAAKAATAEGEEREGLTAEAVALAQAAESATVPATPQLVADDATPEAVTSLLADQGGRLAVMSAEGGIFDIIAGRYSGTPNLEVFLKGHAGDRLRVNRQSRKEFLDHPALTMGLAVQPDVLEDIAKVRGFDGRGLLARFLYATPESLVGRRKIVPDPIPPAVAAAYERNLSALALSLAEWTDPAVLQLTPEADKALISYQERIEPQLAGRGGSLGHISKWAGKVAGAVVRIAGLLHLAAHLRDGYGRPLDRATMDGAIQLGEYFTAHALRVFDTMGADPVVARARSILTMLRDDDRPTVSARDIFSKVSRTEFRTMADLDPAVTLLEDHGYLRTETPPPRTGGPGRRPSPRYQVHPCLRDDT